MTKLTLLEGVDINRKAVVLLILGSARAGGPPHYLSLLNSNHGTPRLSQERTKQLPLFESIVSSRLRFRTLLCGSQSRCFCSGQEKGKVEGLRLAGALELEVVSVMLQIMRPLPSGDGLCRWCDGPFCLSPDALGAHIIFMVQPFPSMYTP